MLVFTLPLLYKTVIGFIPMSSTPLNVMTKKLPVLYQMQIMFSGGERNCCFYHERSKRYSTHLQPELSYQGSFQSVGKASQCLQFYLQTKTVCQTHTSLQDMRFSQWLLRICVFLNVTSGQQMNGSPHFIETQCLHL